MSADKVFDFAQEYRSKNGIAPSIRDIADGCGLRSTSHVAWLLGKLEADGKIKRVPGVARGIVLQEQANYKSGL